jgi:hypothetical protein
MNRSPTDHRPLPTTGRVSTYRDLVRKPRIHLFPTYPIFRMTHRLAGITWIIQSRAGAKTG